MKERLAVGLSIIILASCIPVAAQEENPLLIKVEPAKLTPLKEEALSWVDDAMPELANLSDEIWRAAELAMEEYRSSEALASYLEQHGFAVERGVAGLPTAFVGVFGSGQPVIGFLAEYDALPSLSQETVTTKRPVKEGAPGHGCGHNIFGAASVGAAVGAKEIMARHKIPGTLKVFGCPAEETVEGKVFMARAGVFEGLSCCIQWHPSSENAVSLESSNALNQFELEFFGRTAHSAGDPWHGRSALDAIELTDIGLNFLREHLQPTARIHYVIQEGGKAPNVVPDYARAWYYVRDIDRESVEKDYERVLKIIDGAARMTETTYKVHFKSGVHETLANRAGSEVVYANFLLIGPPAFNEKEQAFAKEIQKEIGVEEKGLKTEIEPFSYPEKSWGSGSTDVAEVSWLTPTTSLGVAFTPIGIPGHHWGAVACAGTSVSHKCLATAAKVMAASCLDFLARPETIQKMREEWTARKKGREYRSPLPDDLKPRVVPGKEGPS